MNNAAQEGMQSQSHNHSFTHSNMVHCFSTHDSKPVTSAGRHPLAFSRKNEQES